MKGVKSLTRAEELLGSIEATALSYVPELFRAQVKKDIEALRKEITTLQRANAKLIKRIGSMMSPGRRVNE